MDKIKALWKLTHFFSLSSAELSTWYYMYVAWIECVPFVSSGSKPVAESLASADIVDAPPRTSSAALEFLPPPLDQVQEEEWEVER